MFRLLIADAEGVFAKALQKHLQEQYLIRVSRSGTQCLKLIPEFEPDIAVIDLSISGADGLSVIRALRDSGRSTKVIALSTFRGEYVLSALESLGVEYVFYKPCDLGAVVSCIRDLDVTAGWQLEKEADRLLLAMGFRMRRTAYACVFDALCVKYRNFHCAATKELYPMVAKMHRSNSKQVEKAIRDAIQAAWRTGNRSLWKLYFLHADIDCPSNDEFLSRMAKALMCGQRLRLPLAEEM